MNGRGVLFRLRSIRKIKRIGCSSTRWQGICTICMSAILPNWEKSSMILLWGNGSRPHKNHRFGSWSFWTLHWAISKDTSIPQNYKYCRRVSLRRVDHSSRQKRPWRSGMTLAISCMLWRNRKIIFGSKYKRCNSWYVWKIQRSTVSREWGKVSRAKWRNIGPSTAIPWRRNWRGIS